MIILTAEATRGSSDPRVAFTLLPSSSRDKMRQWKMRLAMRAASLPCGKFFRSRNRMPKTRSRSAVRIMNLGNHDPALKIIAVLAKQRLANGNRQLAGTKSLAADFFLRLGADPCHESAVIHAGVLSLASYQLLFAFADCFFAQCPCRRPMRV